MKLSIEFYHGRDTLDEKLEDWGYRGPRVAIDWFISTYTCMRFGTDSGEDYDLTFIEDLVYMKNSVTGKEEFYGDFSIQEANGKEMKFEEFCKIY